MITSNSQATIWDARLAWAPNNAYYDIVNWDITNPSYSDRLRPTSFSLRKRKGYRRDNRINEELGSGWTVEDTIVVEDNGVDWEFIMWVSADRLSYKILTRPVDNCDCLLVAKTGTRLENAPTNFVSFDWIKWDRRKTVRETLASSPWQFETDSKIVVDREFNPSGSVLWWTYLYTESDYYLNYDSPSVTLANSPDIESATAIQNWDYVAFINVSWGTFEWEVRQIVGWFVGDVSSPSDWDTADYKEIAIKLDSDLIWRTSPTDNTETWVNISVYSDFWESFFFTDWTSYLTRAWNQATATGWDCWFTIDATFLEYDISTAAPAEIIGSVAFDNNTYEYNSFGTIVALGWYYNRFVYEDNVEIWKVGVALVPYREFLMVFGTGFINTVVYNTTTQEVSNYELRDDIWLWSANAHDVFDNSLYVVTSDKRLQAVDVLYDWGQYTVRLNDLSWVIKWELDLLREWDEVNVQADGNQLRVFINTKTSPSSTTNDSTKILVFERDYQFWHKHTICWERIRWGSAWVYVGNGLYEYCWTEDSHNGTSWDSVGEWLDYDSYVSLFVWENEVNGLWVTNFAHMQMNYIKVALWYGRYTDGDTRIRVEYYKRWVRYYRDYDQFTHIPWVNLMNTKYWGTEPNLDCYIAQESGSSVVENVWDADWNKETEYTNADNECICEDATRTYHDFCNNVHEVWKGVQPFHVFYIPTEELGPCDMFKIEVRTTGDNDMTFEGMMGELTQAPLSIVEWMNEATVLSC